MSIEDRVKEVIGHQLAVKVERVQSGYSLTEDLCADSLDLVELVMELEDEFFVEISDEEFENVASKTVHDVVVLIEKLVSEK